MTNTTQASLLNRSHLGLKVRVTVNDGDCVDVLSGVSHSANIIAESRLFKEVPDYVLGRSETTITLLHFGEVQLVGTSPVEVFPA